ncbi:MAG: DUF692 domain-containing protein, partial [Deltaproteobacteria bacterium]|nr:DUF692 domain-containing protein [Nannocystaceae bacterium]
MPANSTARGIGLGHRPELAADLIAGPSVVDFVEVVAEACMANPSARREAHACKALWPVITHGVKLSLGSADGIDDAHAQRLGRLARELDAPLVSEHASFTRGGSREIGHLTRLPYTRAAIGVLARNVARARRFLPDVPLLLENVAATLEWREDEMDEPEFHCELVRATGCPMLLDLGNLYANAVNRGRDPLRELLRFPLAHVAMLHVAGGAWEHGFYLDTHADPIPDPVYELARIVTAEIGAVPILLERDAGFGRFADLLAELERLRAMTTDVPAYAPPARRDDGRVLVDSPELVGLQRELAEALIAAQAPGPAIEARFGTEALARTRTILARKRIDDAMPHLPRLSAHLSALRDGIRELAASALLDHPLTPSRASSPDAWRILQRALL